MLILEIQYLGKINLFFDENSNILPWSESDTDLFLFQLQSKLNSNRNNSYLEQ